MNKKIVKNTDRFTQLALVAAQEALHDACWANPDALHETYASHRIGVSIGCTFGGVQSLEQGSTRISSRSINKSEPPSSFKIDS